MSTVGTLLPKEDVAALEGTFGIVVRLVRASDWAGWAALYTEDAVFHPPNGPAVRGRAAIRKWGDAFPPVEAFDFSNIEISGEGNVAYGTSGYTLTIQQGTDPPYGSLIAVA